MLTLRGIQMEDVPEPAPILPRQVQLVDVNLSTWTLIRLVAGIVWALFLIALLCAAPIVGLAILLKTTP